MFTKKEKLEFDSHELSALRYALVDFRNDLIKQNRYTDVIDEVLVKLKNKVRLDIYQTGALIHAIDAKRSKLNAEKKDISEMQNLMDRIAIAYRKLEKKQ